MPNPNDKDIRDYLVDALLMGTRVVPAIGGAVLGGGSTFGLGALAGGAAGGALGESLAQEIERYLGRREALDPRTIALTGALGAIPMGRVAQVGRLGRMAREAAKGGVIGAGSDIAFQATEQGTLRPQLDLGRTLLSTGMGGAFGSAGGIAARKIDRDALVDALTGPGSQVGAVGTDISPLITAAERRLRSPREQLPAVLGPDPASPYYGLYTRAGEPTTYTALKDVLKRLKKEGPAPRVPSVEKRIEKWQAKHGTDPSESQISEWTATATAMASRKGLPLAWRAFDGIFDTPEGRKLRVLDFGSGKKNANTVIQRDKGFNVEAHDLNQDSMQLATEGGYRAQLGDQYDVVVAANVVNVADTPTGPTGLLSIVQALRRRVTDDGMVIVNYPPDPRKMVGMKPSDLETILRSEFGSVQQVFTPGRAKGVKGRKQRQPHLPASAIADNLGSLTENAPLYILRDPIRRAPEQLELSAVNLGKGLGWTGKELDTIKRINKLSAPYTEREQAEALVQSYLDRITPDAPQAFDQVIAKSSVAARVGKLDKGKRKGGVRPRLQAEYDTLQQKKTLTHQEQERMLVLEHQIEALTRIGTKPGGVDPLVASGGRFPGFDQVNLPGQRHIDSKELSRLRRKQDAQGNPLLTGNLKKDTKTIANKIKGGRASVLSFMNIPTTADLDGLMNRGFPWRTFYKTSRQQVGKGVAPAHQVTFLADQAVYSPQSSPETALVPAVAGLARREAGLPTSGTGTSTTWVNRRAVEENILDPTLGGSVPRGAFAPGAFQDIGQEGLKIRSYRDNLLETYDIGEGPVTRITPEMKKQRRKAGENVEAWEQHVQDEAVTIDIWMASLYGIDASLLQNNTVGRELYVAMANDLRKKARAFRKQGPDGKELFPNGVTPSEYQAGVWAGIRQNIVEGGETIGGVLAAKYGQPTVLPKITFNPLPPGQVRQPVRLSRGETEARYMTRDEHHHDLGVPHDTTLALREPGGVDINVGRLIDESTLQTVQDTLSVLQTKQQQGQPVGASFIHRTGEEASDVNAIFVGVKHRTQKGKRAGKLESSPIIETPGMATEQVLVGHTVDYKQHLHEPDTVQGVVFTPGRQRINNPRLAEHGQIVPDGKTTIEVAKMIPNYRKAVDAARLNEQTAVWENGLKQAIEISDIDVSYDPAYAGQRQVMTVERDLGAPKFADKKQQVLGYDLDAGDFMGWSKDGGVTITTPSSAVPPLGQNTARIRGELIYDLYGAPGPQTKEQVALLGKNTALGAGVDSVNGDFRQLQGKPQATIEKELKALGYQGYYEDANRTTLVWFGEPSKGWNYPWNPKGY